MKALTVHQPYATLIAIGAKPWEFRGWRPPRSLIGQRIAIHAAARKSEKKVLLAILSALRKNQLDHYCVTDKAIGCCMTALDDIEAGTPLDTLPLSRVLAYVTLGEPIYATEAATIMDGRRRQHPTPGTRAMMAWPMLDVVPTCSALVRGMQGFWNYPEGDSNDPRQRMVQEAAE
jgi:ASCH domain